MDPRIETAYIIDCSEFIGAFKDQQPWSLRLTKPVQPRHVIDSKPSLPNFEGVKSI